MSKQRLEVETVVLLTTGVKCSFKGQDRLKHIFEIGSDLLRLKRYLF